MEEVCEGGGGEREDGTGGVLGVAEADCGTDEGDLDAVRSVAAAGTLAPAGSGQVQGAHVNVPL